MPSTESIRPRRCTWRRRTGEAKLALALGLALVAGRPDRSRADVQSCDGASTRLVAEAIERIEISVDPCGESAQVVAVLETLRQCRGRAYHVCTRSDVSRNLFDRPLAVNDAASPRTITWNPNLRSELEPSCAGDAGRPVLRDPTASLLHELVHAAHDCVGVDPGPLEAEAVRIENIYRRAAGLCQRSGYGDERLAPGALVACAPGRCPCSRSGSGETARNRETRIEQRPDGTSAAGATQTSHAAP